MDTMRTGKASPPLTPSQTFSHLLTPSSVCVAQVAMRDGDLSAPQTVLVSSRTALPGERAQGEGGLTFRVFPVATLG